MKRTIKSIMFVAAVAMAFTACNIEPVETPEVTTGTHTVKFIASQVDTKTTMEINDGVASFAWEDTDKAYFHIFENGVGVTGEDIDAELDNGIMTISAVFPDSSAPYTYTGFMAATVSNDNPSVSNEQIDFGAYDPESDILVAKPVTDKTPEDILEGILFQFKRVVAINQMTLKGLTEGETVTGVTITSDKPIAGEYDFANGAWNASETSISITAEAVANTDGQAVVYFVSAPVEDAQLTITATTAAGKTYTKELAKTISFTEGGVKAFGVKMESSEEVPPTPVELFYESFDDNEGTGGNDNQWSGSIASSAIKSDHEDWTFANGSGASKCAKFGAGSKKGSATTPEITCNGDIVLTFKAAAWDGSNEKTTLNIKATRGTVSVSSVNLVKGAWTEYTITISGVETSTQITFEAANASNNRFFLDEVKVVTAIPDTRTALFTPANLAVDASTKVVSWDAVENAGSYLVTIGDNAPVDAATNSYNATAIADEYYNVSVVAVPTDTDTYKNSAAATLEGAKFGNPSLAKPTLSAGAIDETSITVTWTNDPRATNGYEAIIYKDNGDNTLWKLTNADSDQMRIMTGSATFTELEENQEYEIRVFAMPVTEPREYLSSDFGIIKATTVAAKHASDVTTAANYTIKGLTVYAVNGSNVIAGDETGYILLYKSSHGLTVGDTFDLAGESESYNGVYEFKIFTITNKQNGDAPVYGTPVELAEADLKAYASEPYINYVTIKGFKQSNGYLMEVGDEIVNIYGSTADYYGKYVTVTGFVFGYYSGKTNLMLVDIEEDTTVPTLSIDNNRKEWAWNNTDAFVVNVTANGGSWTISPETLDWATVAVDAVAGTITVTPKGQNTSEADYEATITVTHSADAGLTETITLKQVMESEGGEGGDTKLYTAVITVDNIDKAGTGSGYALYNGNHKVIAVASDGTEKEMTFTSSQVMPGSSANAGKMQFQASKGTITGTDWGTIESITADKALTVTKNGGNFSVAKTSSGAGYYESITIVFSAN